VTETIIGSEDLVAADWIGAAKMGLDPMVSDYMKQAVEAFGKPQIKLVGDRSLYPGWVNVTDVIPAAAFGGLDKNYYFGTSSTRSSPTWNPSSSTRTRGSAASSCGN